MSIWPRVSPLNPQNEKAIHCVFLSFLLLSECISLQFPQRVGPGQCGSIVMTDNEDRKKNKP